VALATLESRMRHISGFGRDQLLSLPEAVDGYVDAENPVRFIDVFVDGLDLAAAGFALRVTAAVTALLIVLRVISFGLIRLLAIA
jgi:hypothetical protein